MKFFFSIIFLFNLIILNAFVIPFSNTELKENKNHISGFVRVSPNDSLKLKTPTDIWIWQNAKALYLLWESEINKDFEKGNFVSNDNWPDADFFRVQIITDIKNYYSYTFFAFPLKSKLDGIRNENMNFDNNWDSSYEYQNDISNNKWTCLMKIPFKDLRFSGKAPYNWKMIFTKYNKKDDEYYSIPYLTTEMKKDYFRKAFDCKIPNKIVSNRNFIIKPYLMYKYDVNNQKTSFDKDNFGLDLSFNPNFSTKVKLSFNPDFSDIPIDDETDNFNVKYAPTFNENRYFFVEDLDVFGVGNNLFYSRNIMQPQFAAKITSDNSNNSWGILSSLDKKIEQNGEVTNSNDFYNLAAYKIKGDKFNSQTTFLNRMHKKYHNDVLHFSNSYEILKDNYLWLNTDFSFWKDIVQKTGNSIYLGYNGKKGNLGWNTSFGKMGQDFRADMGIINDTGYYSANLNIYYNNNQYEKYHKFITEYGVSCWSNYLIDDFGDDKPEKGAGTNFWFNTKNKFNLWSNTNFGSEKFNSKIFNWYNVTTGINYYKYQIFKPSANFSQSKSLVYSLEKLFTKRVFSFEIDGRIKPCISYDASLKYKKYSNLPKNSGVDDSYCLGNSNLSFNISNNLGITGGVRYNNYESNSYTKHLGIYSNLNWKLKEKCNMYVGYSTAENNIEDKVVKDYENLYIKVIYTF